MPLTDHYGNALSTTSHTARDALDSGVALFLGANYGAVEAFSRAVSADPGFALGHAALARALMMAGDMAAAKHSIAHARTLAGGITPREAAHIDILALLLAGKATAARAAVFAHVRDYPRDALIAQLCANVFGLIGFSGEVGREAELLAYTATLLPHYPGDWWMMSMHALSLCETGRTDASMRLMDQSLALEPRNANASHFKAHAQYEAGETAAGRACLAAWMEGYDTRAVLHGHLSWHQALWALAEGDDDTMWRVIDANIAPGASHSLPINILTDTAAIFYRAELAGFCVDPARWSALSDYAARFFPETGQSFADFHAALSHAMAGNGDRLAHVTDTAKGFAGDLVRPLARAFGAIARDDWASALDDLTPVLTHTERLGGSRAQRDLIELTAVNVLLRLNRPEEARRTLATRRPVLAKAPPLVAMT